jgi:uncharacterized membrane protein YfbV (UPF0208 family)
VVKEGLFAQRMLLPVAILALLALIATGQRNLAALTAAHATRGWPQWSDGGDRAGTELPAADEPSG